MTGVMATLIIKFASNGNQPHYQPVPVHVWIKSRPRCCILLGGSWLLGLCMGHLRTAGFLFPTELWNHSMLNATTLWCFTILVNFCENFRFSNFATGVTVSNVGKCAKLDYGLCGNLPKAINWSNACSNVLREKTTVSLELRLNNFIILVPVINHLGR